jgi:carbamoyl-phosphate synthase large subunit
MRDEFHEPLLQLLQLGYRIAATPGTAAYYAARGVAEVAVLSKPVNATAHCAHPADTAASVATEDDAATASSHHAEAGVQGTVLEWIRNKRVDLVINIPEGSTRTDEVTSGYLMRRTAVDFGCSLLTNIK